MVQDFVNTLDEIFLYQHVNKPTRHRLGEKSNILDLVITNEEGIVSDIDHLPGLGKNDHACLLFNVNCQKKKDEINVKRYNVFKDNYTEIEKILEDIDWATLLKGGGGINNAYNAFSEGIQEAVKGNIPLKRNSSRKKYIYDCRHFETKDFKTQSMEQIETN